MEAIKKKKKKKAIKSDKTSLATWARLRAAGKVPIGAKPNGAEKSGYVRPEDD